VPGTWSEACRCDGFTADTRSPGRIPGVERFDSAAADLVRGEERRVKVTGHEPWGVTVTLVGHEGLGAAVDAAAIDSPSGSARALPEEYPPIGAELDAVITEIDRYVPPVWIRLTLRAADLEVFRRRCGFCGRDATLSRGGDGIVLDVRSVDGPGSTSIVAHRQCLIECLHPTAVGEPARVAKVGHPPTAS
jgi:hypothetical protein